MAEAVFHVDELVEEVDLEGLPRQVERILAGQVTGRVLVKVG